MVGAIWRTVKTAHGLSERETLEELVLQGDKFGSLMTSVQVDKIGTDCLKTGFHYSYKNSLPIGFLGMVDDIVGISEAGPKASELNAFMNIKTAEKTLQFGPKKCKSMIVGKCESELKVQSLQVDHWISKHVVNTTTGEQDFIETYGGKVDMERTEENI